MSIPRIVVQDNWFSNLEELLTKAKSGTFTAKKDQFGEDNEILMSTEGEYNMDWKLLRRFEKVLGYKIINWRDNGTDIPNGAFIKTNLGEIQENDYPILSIGTPNPDPYCLVGLLPLGLGTEAVSLKILENNIKKGEYELVRNRLVIIPGNSQFIITEDTRISSGSEGTANNLDMYFQVFRFNLNSRPLGNDYWHRLDRQLTYRIMPCFPKELCDSIIKEAEATNWTTARHNLYPTTDIPVDSLVNSKDQINDIVQNKVFTWLEEWFGVPKEAMYMNDLFVVKYSADGQRNLKIHRDVSILSFNVLLNEASDFDGGGTRIYYIDKLVGIQKGEVLMHSGKLYHAGNEVTRGNRYIMVGFVGLNTDMINHDLRKEIYKRTLTDDEVMNSLFLY